MPDRTAAPQPSDREAAAAYVASLAGELAAIARDHRLETLCYLLEMARMEARSQSVRSAADDPG